MADSRIIVIDPKIRADLGPELDRIEALHAHPGEQVRLNGGRFMMDTDETVATRQAQFGDRPLTVAELRLDQDGPALRVNYRFVGIDGVHSAMHFDRGGESLSQSGTLIARDGDLWFHPMIERRDERGEPMTNEFGETLSDPADHVRLVHPEFTRAGKWAMDIAEGERDGMTMPDLLKTLSERPAHGEYHFIVRQDGTLQLDFQTGQTAAMAVEVTLAERAIERTEAEMDRLRDRDPGGDLFRYGTMITRDDQIWFHPLQDMARAGQPQVYRSAGPAERVSAELSATAMEYIGIPAGEDPKVYAAYLEAQPRTGYFEFDTLPGGALRLSAIAWHGETNPAELTLAEQGIGQAIITATERQETATMADQNTATNAASNSASDFDPDNSDTLPPELTYDDWRAHLDALAEQREQEYARDTMEIAQQQARGELTQAQEINEGVWSIAADREQRGVFVLNAKNPLANPDRRAVILPNERGAEVDQFRAAEALWQHYRRSLAVGGLEAAKMLNAAAVAHRQAVAPSGTIEQGDTHKNAEQSQHRTDADNRDRPFTVVAHTMAEAKVIRGFMKMADDLLPRDKEALRAGSIRSLVPMQNGEPVMPSAKDLARHFNTFRPRHPAILAQKESVGVFVSHPHYDAVRPALQAAQAGGRRIVAIEGAAADRTNADVTVRKVEHQNYVVGAWKTNIELLSQADRLVVVWNGKPRDPAMHLIANAVRAGKPISVFDGEGKAMDPVAVSRDAIREYPSTRERDAMSLREDVANLGHLGSAKGQVFLQAMGFAAENAMKFGINNIHGHDLASALGSAEHLGKLAAQAKIPSPALRPFNENAQRVQAALTEAKSVMAVCEHKNVEVITPFASDHFPRKLAAEFPVLYVAGDASRLADASSRGIIVTSDRAGPTQPLDHLSYDRPVIAVDGALPMKGNLVANVVVTAADVSQVHADLANKDSKVVVSALPPQMDSKKVDVVALAKTNPSDVDRSVNLATSLANGVLAGDTKIDGIGRKIVDSALAKGKPVAIEDPRGMNMLRADSYTHQLRDIIDAKLTIDGKANLAEAMKANPDHENVVEKLRHEERRQLRQESAAISSMTPAQVQQMNRTAALVTVIPADPKFGPGMEKIFLAKAQAREPAHKRVASGGAR